MCILPLPFFLVLISRVHLVMRPLPSTVPYSSSEYNYIYNFFIIPYLHYYDISLNLFLSFKTSTNTLIRFAFTQSPYIAHVPTASGAALSMLSTSYFSCVSMDLDKTSPPKPLSSSSDSPYFRWFLLHYQHIRAYREWLSCHERPVNHIFHHSYHPLLAGVCGQYDPAYSPPRSTI